MHTRPWVFRSLLSMVGVGFWSSCAFDAALPSDARVRCVDISGCPSGLVCRSGYCIDPSMIDLVGPDLAQPPAIDPARGRAGTRFTIGLVATKPLVEPPELTLRLTPAVVLTCPRTADPQHFSCEYVATGTENGGLGGSIDFDLRLLDTSANETLKPFAGALQLDFSAPVLASASVAPAVARFGATIDVFFTASEPLSGPAVLKASPSLDDGAGGTTTTFVLEPDTATLNYRFRHTVTAADLQGALSFTVSITDVAGNISSDLPVGTTQVDGSLPALLNAMVLPARAKAGTLVEATFEVSKPLSAPPVITVGGITMTRDATVLAPMYRYTHTAVLADGEGLKQVLLSGTDAAGNVLADTVGVTTFDFTVPAVSIAGVAYKPDVTNPLPTVTQAKVGTAIVVNVIANEVLSALTGPGVPPTMTATGGGTTLTFCVVGLTCTGDTRPSSLTSTGATFEAVVPVGAASGTYLPTLTWTDLAGNTGPATFTTPPIVVKTSTAALVVNQAQVSFVRSPWGNAAIEDLGAFVIPAGPYFALAPVNPLGNVATLPTATFSFGATTPAVVRVWSDTGKTGLLGSLSLNADGGWPRQRLANQDVPTAYVSGVDEAGNESASVKLQNAEWVATVNAPPVGVNPHRLETNTVVRESVSQHLSTLAGSEAQGADATAIIARAEVAWNERLAAASNPPARQIPQMAYDTARGRLMIFGGSALSGGLQDVWEHDGQAWTDKTPPSGAMPASGVGYATAYDSARGRVVLVATNAQQVWEWDGTSWLDKTPSGLKPSSRSVAAMAFDAARARVVLFGGFAGSYLQDTWEWDGAAWVDRTPPTTKPSARASHAMAYDVARARVVMFGGTPAGVMAQDVWEWDGNVWEDKTPAGTKPEARSDSAMTYDRARARVVLFGGQRLGGTLQDLWEWNGATWVDKTPAGTKPPARRDHGVAYDSVRARVVIFAGNSGNGRLADLWSWNGTAWLEETATGNKPAARVRHAMAFDTVRGQVVMFGGVAGGTTLMQDVWEWNGASWTDKTPGGTMPARRTSVAMAFDSTRNRVVLFGGATSAGEQQDTWEWDGAAWVDKTPAGTKPPARREHALAYDSQRGRLVLFGGMGGTGPLQDVWEWDGTSWLDRTLVGTKPSARSLHTMAFDSARGKVVMFGGVAGIIPMQDVWEWDGTSWVDKTPTGNKPAARFGHAMAYDSTRARVVVFGGNVNPAHAQDLWEWDGSAWVDKTPAATKPSGRGNHAMAYDSARGRTVLFGGISFDYQQDTWELEASPSRQPAVTFSPAGAALAGLNVLGLTVRAHCGGDFAPYGTANIGAVLFGWATQGPFIAPGTWRALATNQVGVNATQPFLPTPNTALMGWTAASAAEAQHYLRTRDSALAFQCRPTGASGVGAQEARVALDYIEARIRYAAP
jgi:hypothetical protein